MKKVLITLLLSSCSYKTNKIYYSHNVDKCIHNLNQMQKWLQEDYQDGLIPRDCAQNYMIVLINTKCSLYKKTKQVSKDIDCTD